MASSYDTPLYPRQQANILALMSTRSRNLTPQLVSGRASTLSVADNDGPLRIFCMIAAESSPVPGSLFCCGTARLSQSKGTVTWVTSSLGITSTTKRYIFTSTSNHTTTQLCGFEDWSEKWLSYLDVVWDEATSDGDETRRDCMCRTMLLSLCVPYCP